MIPYYYKTDELPFAVLGMSDEMPYESTVYGQMTEEMVQTFEAAFEKRVKSAVEEFEAAKAKGVVGTEGKEYIVKIL